jgi:hypothetical protein
VEAPGDASTRAAREALILGAGRGRSDEIAVKSSVREAVWDDRGMRPGLAACFGLAVAGWGHGGAPVAAPEPARASASASAPASGPEPEPAPEHAVAIAAALREAAIEELAVEGDLPIYVVRGNDGKIARTVFLTGSCTTPVTYLTALRNAAAAHGGMIALQGDTLCRDGTRRWSPDTPGISARIDVALLAAGAIAGDGDGDGDGDDDGDSGAGVTVVGYSQGAERAEWLAHQFHAKYTRFVLLAGPIVPAPNRFSGARAVALLAGYGDVRENMAVGAKKLRRANVPAIYLELPGSGHHGELSPASDAVVSSALAWVLAAPPNDAPLAHHRGARVKRPRAH